MCKMHQDSWTIENMPKSEHLANMTITRLHQEYDADCEMSDQDADTLRDCWETLLIIMKLREKMPEQTACRCAQHAHTHNGHGHTTQQATTTAQRVATLPN